MKNAVTEKLIKGVRARASKSPDSDEIAFLRDFYHRLSGQDFAADTAAGTANLAMQFRAAALRHYQLGKTRARGKTLIEIYNTSAPPKQKPNTDIDFIPRDTTVINIITDDKPFVLDSLTIKLNALRKTPHRAVHPSFEVTRDAANRLQKLSRFTGRQAKPDAPHSAGAPTVEAYIQFVIDFTPQNEHAALRRELLGVMADIEIVVQDWQQMRDQTKTLAMEIAAAASSDKGGKNGNEYAELLRWMENNNFAFLGFAEMTVSASGKAAIDGDSALGVLRSACKQSHATAMDILPPLPPAQHSSARVPLVFTKSRRRATIHRANYLDCILIERNDGDTSKPRRVSCILGFIAGASALLPTSAIPHLSNKTDYILRSSTLRPGGHAYKALRTTLETLPREKLFQMDARSLYGLCMTVLNHLERRKTRVHLHRNICGHFYSCLVYVPRDLFNSTLRQRIQHFLRERLDADEVTFNVYFSDSILTRIHYLVHCADRAAHKIKVAELEIEIRRMARDWNDNLFEEARRQNGYDAADQLLALYRDAFPSGYRDEFSSAQGVADSILLSQVTEMGGGKIHARLTVRDGNSNSDTEADHRTASFKLYCDDKSLALSDVLPILENMGIRVLGGRPYRIRRCDGVTLWLHDFEIARDDGAEFDFSDAETFQTAFIQAWCGNIENDGFNQLTLLAGLNWKQISLLRACYRYLKQIRLRYSEQYIIDALAANPSLVVAIAELFDAKFNPSRQNASSEKSLRRMQSAIQRKLDRVASLDEDRIIRALLDVINATLRTNYYQQDGEEEKSYLSLKLNPRSIPRIPEPAPKYEIFVCSPRVEGVHLRGGDVARGGLRWSDRAEDFRTEVLGLVKAQRVKNAVIVPLGSKGGFVAKQLPAERDAARAEVVACYRLFIRGLLDLTDNRVRGRVVPPQDVVRLDGDDPYLVVAADKGTATFSDIANEISGEYNFWLGDAFASGGSAGYDHKKMGITARGAWESVKRHFRERGKDIQQNDFSVVGIGDMAGDVFGNGMLLSKHIRLIAAFNHMHIFIDPSPNAATSFRERKRLFGLARSSWADYDRKLISAGGGVFERSAKSITLSPQAKKALGASQSKFSPDELINLILKADVELLWNGGIGTYVKASFESDAAAQDKHNDGLRVDAEQLRCKVIGEGGNLGMTQLARVEFAEHGGLCYTDAIDNSAGVDTSDHEVNIKILLNDAIAKKVLPAARRNALLAKMEDEIGALVLRNNYVQSQAISLAASRGAKLLNQHSRAILMLEEKELLNRELEFLPDAAALAARREDGKSLTRPEIAVVLAYAKMDLYQALLDSDVPDAAYLATELDDYFPAILAQKFPKLVRAHQLAREIISTQVTNDLVGAMGASFHLRMTYLTGANAAEITRAYIAARDILNAAEITTEIEALDNRVAASVQLEMLGRLASAMQICIAWLLRNNSPLPDIKKTVAAYQPDCKKLRVLLHKSLGENAASDFAHRTKKLSAQKVPTPLAAHIAELPYLGYAVDIAALAAQKYPLAQVAEIYFQVREILALDWVEDAIDALPTRNDWHARARFSLANDLRAGHAAITGGILQGAPRNAKAADAAIQKWLAAHHQPISAMEKMITALKAEHTPDFAMLSVLVSELAWLQ